MAQQVILQTAVEGKLLVVESHGDLVPCEPGRFCVWDTTLGDFTVCNATQDELIEFFVEQATNDVKRKVLSVVHQLKTGEKPYAQFTMGFAQAVERLGALQGPDAVAFTDYVAPPTEAMETQPTNYTQHDTTRPRRSQGKESVVDEIAEQLGFRFKEDDDER